MRRVAKRRRIEGRTDYQARKNLLKSRVARVAFRKSNKYILGQVITSKEAQDSIITSYNSKELLSQGWPETAAGSLKSIPAAYLTGLALGREALKEGIKEAILDIGLNRNTPKSRIYAFAAGIIESGMKMPCDKKMLPEKERIEGKHIEGMTEIFNKVKTKIGGK